MCLLPTSHCDGSTNTGELQARNCWKAEGWRLLVTNGREPPPRGKTEGASVNTFSPLGTDSSMFIGLDPHGLDLYTQTRGKSQ